MFKELAFAFLALVSCSQLAKASDLPLALCPGVSKNVAANPLLQRALKASYPFAKELRETRREPSDAPCLFPYEVVSYDTFVVLLTFAQMPGTACHGCPAEVSAVFLKKDGNALRPGGRHDAFVEAGTFGSLMSAKGFRLGAHDGLMIESGGTFQGYSSSILSPFLIRNGRMEAIGPEIGISSGDSNCGAREEETDPCREVSGEWWTEGSRLIIHYSGRQADDTAVNGDVVYELKSDTLVLVSGAELAAERDENRP